MKHKIRVGRYTAALLLVSTGALLLLDEWRGTDYIFMLQRWWPLLFILLGVEYIVRYTLSRVLGRRREFRFRAGHSGDSAGSSRYGFRIRDFPAGAFPPSLEPGEPEFDGSGRGLQRS
ncbi:Uncharacterised protein [Actinobacillus pleuropneumoniae]|nr:Uncharacterised protein [Actinobacillus pleuropneumoniae]